MAHAERVIGLTFTEAERVLMFVTPSLSYAVLMLTNLTGHPRAVVPNGFTDAGTPVSRSFVGGLFRDADTLELAHAYQQATSFHRRHPDRFVGNRRAVAREPVWHGARCLSNEQKYLLAARDDGAVT